MGIPYDVANRDSLEGWIDYLFELKSPSNFHIANDSTKSREGVRIYMNHWKQRITPYVLPKSPSLVSVGKKTWNTTPGQWFSFIQMSGRNAFFIMPDGNSIARCINRVYIPYTVVEHP